MREDDYEPAERPPGDIPGGDRVRFEKERGVEQSLLGGSAADIERSIMGSTERNIQLLGWRIMKVRDVVGDLGAGTLQEITFTLEQGRNTKVVRITGIGMEVHFDE